MTFSSTKTFGHDLGLSCAFRQWRTDSHCRFIHGYALAVRIVFSADELDCRNWVVDFGSLKSFRKWLEDTFDHKLLVAEDDPHLDRLISLGDTEIAQVVVVPNVGCEAFAEWIYVAVEDWLLHNGYRPRVRVQSVEVSEHGANSAIYSGDLR